MLNNTQDQNEFNDSLYQNVAEKKPMKLIVMILLILIVLGGGLFIFLRQKSEPISTETNNLPVAAIPVTGQTNTVEELKKVEEQLAQFADDKDRDGLSVEKEKELGTSDNDSDTDWDNVSDKDEIEKWGTDPLKADTDGDGFNDGFEITGGFNPKGQGKL